MTTVTLEDLKKFATERDAEFKKELTASVKSAVLECVDQKLDEKLPGIMAKVDTALARTAHLETAALHDYEVRKSNLCRDAKKEFQDATREMFEESGLILAVPRSSQPRRRSGADSETTAATPAVSADTRAAVTAFVTSIVGPGKYTITPVKNGLRLVHASRSSQKRRATADLLLPRHRDDFRSRFNLTLQYDRPFALRQLVRRAYAFLEGAKRACPTITKIGVLKGLCFANSLPIGPIWLVPRGKDSWTDVYEVISRDFGQIPATADDIAPDGFFASLFDQAYAHDAGLRVLQTAPLP
jgi:hypothetical protein